MHYGQNGLLTMKTNYFGPYFQLISERKRTDFAKMLKNALVDMVWLQEADENYDIAFIDQKLHFLSK